MFGKTVVVVKQQRATMTDDQVVAGFNSGTEYPMFRATLEILARLEDEMVAAGVASKRDEDKVRAMHEVGAVHGMRTQLHSFAREAMHRLTTPRK